jgi:hypothetical protein
MWATRSRVPPDGSAASSPSATELERQGVEPGAAARRGRRRGRRGRRGGVAAGRLGGGRRGRGARGGLARRRAVPQQRGQLKQALAVQQHLCGHAAQRKDVHGLPQRGVAGHDHARVAPCTAGAAAAAAKGGRRQGFAPRPGRPSPAAAWGGAAARARQVLFPHKPLGRNVAPLPPAGLEEVVKVGGVVLPQVRGLKGRKVGQQHPAPGRDHRIL